MVVLVGMIPQNSRLLTILLPGQKEVWRGYGFIIKEKKTHITMATKNVFLGPDIHYYQVAWPYKTLESDKHVNGSRSSINTLIISLTRKTYCLLYKLRCQTNYQIRVYFWTYISENNRFCYNQYC